MNDLKILHRLRSIAAESDLNAAARLNAVAADCSAKGRLNSGYFFKKVKHEFQDEFTGAIGAMADYARQAGSYKQAAGCVRTAGGELLDILADRFRKIVDGDAGARALPERTADALHGELRREMQNLLDQNADDLLEGIGRLGFWERHKSKLAVLMAALTIIVPLLFGWWRE